MEEILMSFNPEELKLVLSGKATINIRKSKPKLSTPFKVYVYETRGKTKWCNKCDKKNNCYAFSRGKACFEGRGKIVGECVCDRIYFRNCDIHDFDTITLEELSEWSCKSEDELLKFADRGNLFGWHISNLVIYDKPRELSEFYTKCSKYDLDKKEVYKAHCTDCGNKHGIAPCKYINQRWCIPLKRPPQSWCYVEKKGA